MRIVASGICRSSMPIASLSLASAARQFRGFRPFRAALRQLCRLAIAASCRKVFLGDADDFAIRRAAFSPPFEVRLLYQLSPGQRRFCLMPYAAALLIDCFDLAAASAAQQLYFRMRVFSAAIDFRSVLAPCICRAFLSPFAQLPSFA